MRDAPFTRPTVLFDFHTQASFDQAVLRPGLKTPSDTSLSVRKNAAEEAAFILQHPTQVLSILDGSMTLAEAVVREAVSLTKYNSQSPRLAPLMRG